jgi:hypothetical protein
LNPKNGTGAGTERRPQAQETAQALRNPREEISGSQIGIREEEEREA